MKIVLKSYVLAALVFICASSLMVIPPQARAQTSEPVEPNTTKSENVNKAADVAASKLLLKAHVDQDLPMLIRLGKSWFPAIAGGKQVLDPKDSEALLAYADALFVYGLAADAENVLAHFDVKVEDAGTDSKGVARLRAWHAILSLEHMFRKSSRQAMFASVMDPSAKLTEIFRDTRKALARAQELTSGIDEPAFNFRIESVEQGLANAAKTGRKEAVRNSFEAAMTLADRCQKSDISHNRKSNHITPICIRLALDAAALFSAAGKSEAEAYSYLKAKRETYLVRLTAKHPQWAIFQQQFANAARMAGQTDEARAAFELGHAYWETVSDFAPMDHAHAGAAVFYMGLNDIEMAVGAFKKQFDALAASFDSDDPELAKKALWIIDWSASGAGEFAKIGILSAILGDTKRLALGNTGRRKLLNRLAYEYQEAGFVEEARHMRRRIDKMPLPSGVVKLLSDVEAGRLKGKALDQKRLNQVLTERDYSTAYRLNKLATERLIEELGLQGDGVLLGVLTTAGDMQAVGKEAEAFRYQERYFRKLLNLKDPDINQLRLALGLHADALEDNGHQTLADYYRDEAATRLATHHLSRAEGLWNSKGDFLEFGTQLAHANGRLAEVGRNRLRMLDVYQSYLKRALAPGGADGDRAIHLVHDYASWLQENGEVELGKAVNDTAVFARVHKKSQAWLCHSLRSVDTKNQNELACPDIQQEELRDPKRRVRVTPKEEAFSQLRRTALPEEVHAKLELLKKQVDFLPATNLIVMADRKRRKQPVLARAIRLAVYDTLKMLKYRNAALEAHALNSLAHDFLAGSENNLAQATWRMAVDILIADGAYIDSGLGKVVVGLIENYYLTGTPETGDALAKKILADIADMPAARRLKKRINDALKLARKRLARKQEIQSARQITPIEAPQWALEIVTGHEKTEALKLLSKAKLASRLGTLVAGYASLRDREGTGRKLAALHEAAAETFGEAHTFTGMLAFRRAQWILLDRSFRHAVPLLRQVAASKQPTVDDILQLHNLYVPAMWQYAARALEHYEGTAQRLRAIEAQAGGLLERAGGELSKAEAEQLTVLGKAYIAAAEYEKAAKVFVRLAGSNASVGAPAFTVAERAGREGTSELSLACGGEYVIGLGSAGRDVQADCAVAVGHVLAAWLRRVSEGAREFVVASDNAARRKLRDIINGRMSHYFSNFSSLLGVPHDRVQALLAEGLALAEFVNSNDTESAAAGLLLRSRLGKSHPGGAAAIGAYRRASDDWRRATRDLIFVKTGENTEALKAAVDRKRQRLDQLRLRHADILREHRLLSLNTSLDIGAIRQALAPDEAIISYFVDENIKIAWVLRRGGIYAFNLSFVLESLRRDVRLLRRDLNPAGTLKDVNVARSHALYQALVGPLHDALAGATTLFISPGPELSWLPFDALVTRPPKQPTWTVDADWRPHWLISDFGVALLPATSVFADLRGNGGEQGRAAKLIAAGAPHLSTAGKDDTQTSVAAFENGRANPQWLAQFEPLPAAVTEINDARAAFPDGAAATVTGPQFTETWMKSANLKDYRFMLLATHAKAGSATNPAFMLMSEPAHGSGSDGAMTATEIRDLDLDLDVVFLSACETGRGRGNTGGYGPLVSAFYSAGARNIVATHWPIASKAAGAVTVPVLRQLARNGVGEIVPALTETKRRLSKMGSQFSHPAHWAAFFLVGAPRKEVAE
ncbi:MAG: CHAT domain-containing protein [Alphaproteobacteria bacterium]|nr:CHAT domain-containing protein [Alphaproteobacteria bacterium]